MKGYAGKILEIDLTKNKIDHKILPEDILRKYIGGRGLATKILWDRLGSRWEEIDPLGEENPLLILTGPLTGYFPGGRVCVSGKSPQSNGVIGSTVAGEFGIDLRCAGYDGIILSGKAPRPSLISIFDQNVEIKSAKHIWGKEAKETLRTVVDEEIEHFNKLNPQKGEWKDPSVLYIGPAGETKSRMAAVMAKWSHAAGYGGYGAVMGSKNIKAISVKGTGPLPEAANMKETSRHIDEICTICFKDEYWRRWGTGDLGYDCGNRTSSEPIKNWQEEWHDEKSFGVDRFEERVWIKRYWGDFGCPTTCLKLAMPKTGPFYGAIGDNPDYELQAYVGTNLGIFSPEDNVYLAARMDDLGLCGINGGNVLGFAGELYQRKILTRKDLGGLDLRWGNTKDFEALARMIAARKGIGKILAEGTYRAALTLSKMKKKDLLPYAVQSKGVSIGAHGIRSGEDYPGIESYACSVQGGDHTSTAKLPLDHDNSELTIIFYDSGVYCWFNTFDIPRETNFELLNAVTGWNITKQEWYDTLALRILHLQRALLLLGGPDTKWKPKTDDKLPAHFFEPLPTGPYKGKKITQDKLEDIRNEYYEAVGWDKNGIPTSETLKRLDIEDVDHVLRKKLP